MLALPTNDDLMLVSVSGTLMQVPELDERLAAGRREERFFGSADLPNFYRQSSGAGWALAGDAASQRDPVTGQGISDALTTQRQWLRRCTKVLLELSRWSPGWLAARLSVTYGRVPYGSMP